MYGVSFFGYYLVPKNIFKINLNLKNIENFYLRNSTIIIYIVSLVIIIFTLINFIFGIFQKGFVSNLFLGNIFRNLIAFFFMIGFGTAVAFVINFELNRKRYNILYLSLLETFFTSFSSLSRAMIFNFFPYLVGYLAKINQHKIKKKKLKKILIFIIILLSLTVISVVGTSKIRTDKNIIRTSSNFLEINNLFINANYKNQNLIKFINISNNTNLTKENLHFKTKEYFKLILNIISFRFVGIEGVMSVQSKNNKTFSLYVESLKEKYKENNISFYDKNFLDQTSSYKSSLLKFENQHAITLPGFIAHSFYSGSYIFVFLAALLVSIFCNIILLIIEKCSKTQYTVRLLLISWHID